MLLSAEERARALSSLLPGARLADSAIPGAPLHSGPGQRFMTDLLVSSLMADGGLESALSTALTKETRAIEEELKVRSCYFSLYGLFVAKALWWFVRGQVFVCDRIVCCAFCWYAQKFCFVSHMGRHA